MELEQIEGTVEDIIYENPDNGYTVFEISGGGTVTVVCGIVGELHAGESVVCRGKYENHATYGRQFHAQECETDMPKNLEAVYAFLASGSLPYIFCPVYISRYCQYRPIGDQETGCNQYDHPFFHKKSLPPIYLSSS